PEGNVGHGSPSIVLNGQSLQRSENGTSIASSNSVSCNAANQSSSYCNTNTSAYQSAKFSKNKPSSGLANDTGLHFTPHSSK
ncbi:MAG TPA: hypothetical protein VIR31_01860, partial [Nitrososphaeraceae archaeon]